MSMFDRRYVQTAGPDPRDRLGLGQSAPLPTRRVLRVIARGAPFDRGPRRNVLVEDTATGERFVRPFRGLTRQR